MRAVILDIDGTLLESAEDDDRLYRESVVAALGPVRLRADLGDYSRVTDTGILEQIAADNGIRFDAGMLTEVRQVFLERMREHIDRTGPFEAVPGAVDFLGRLRASPLVSVAIATGGWRATARLKLDSAGLAVGHLPLASSDDATARADIMRIALDSLDGAFETITYVGDGAWDRSASAELGWHFQPVGAGIGGIASYDELSSLSHWSWLYEDRGVA